MGAGGVGIKVATTWSRFSVLLRRRYSRVRHVIPPSWARRYTVLRSASTDLRRFHTAVAARTDVDNIFHCCVHKTGSQWLMSMLSDPIVYRYSGLTFFTPQRQVGRDVRPVGQRTFARPFPGGRIISPLYVSYPHFQALPKAGTHRAFFVLRDPRDLIVSWYFSMRDTHVQPPPDNPLAQARADLRALPDVEDGLIYAIDYWIAQGMFDTLRSWAVDAGDDPAVRLVRYEDLTGPDAHQVFADLFAFLAVRIPDDDLESLLEAYHFRRLSGRTPGDTNQRSHLRVGKGGDWPNHFTDPVTAAFQERTGDLVAALGYAWNPTG